MKKTALVTGGSKRMGRYISIALAERGYNIALHYNTSKTEAKTTEKKVREKKVGCALLPADFTDPQQVEKLIPKVIKELGNLTLLVNNASVFERKTFSDTTKDVFNRQFRVNFQAPFLLSQIFARQITKGQIINILDTKVAGLPKHYFIYTLTKKFLYEFTRMAAKDLAPDIRVNGISPGLILPSEKMSDSMIESVIKRTPLKKKGEMNHITSALDFFLENDFITGEVIFVDGGKHLG